MSKIVRTPAARFESLVGYTFESHFVEVTAPGLPGVQMHYVDAGPKGGPVVLLLHGQPTWSYLYRSTIDVLTAAGLRAIAPDHIGFGRSDKPTERTEYTVERHISWLTSFVEALGLEEITLVVQDWGGPIGLGVLAGDPDRFARVVATNTVLHTGDPSLADTLTWANYGLGTDRVVLEEALVNYLLYFVRAPTISASAIVNAVAGPLDEGVLRAYDAPFPTDEHTAGLRQLTALMPLTRSDPGAVLGRRVMDVLGSFSRPFLTAFSDGDPATAGWETVFQRHVPGADGQPHVQIEGAGHFVQEQRGDELGRVIGSFVASDLS